MREQRIAVALGMGRSPALDDRARRAVLGRVAVERADAGAREPPEVGDVIFERSEQLVFERVQHVRISVRRQALRVLVDDRDVDRDVLREQQMIDALEREVDRRDQRLTI